MQGISFDPERELSRRSFPMQTHFTSFGDLAAHVAAIRAEDEARGGQRDDRYDAAFAEGGELAMLSVVDEPERIEMPDPQQCQAAVDMLIQTLFDVLRDTRMEPFAADLAWGFVNSFHVVAKRIEAREDDAAKKLGDLARSFDPSEVYANDLEETQTLCQTLQACREAMECMRDHAGEVYRVETGRPFAALKGSRVSSALSASMIEARDYLAGRARLRREQYAPEGPVVAFSGGQQWHNHELLFDRLDRIKARIPEMILVTTAQSKGCDAIATAWAASRRVKVVQFRLDRSQGNRAAFVRNDRITSLRPVEAIVCEGSGVQANLAQKLRQAGVPLHVLRACEQRASATA
jgi:hypothetical protein